MRFRAALIALLAIAFAAPPADAAEQVMVKLGEMNMPATLFRPAGDGPHPAVVALHGCSSLTDPKGGLRAFYADWGERLAAAGFVVIFPDSFAIRGASSQCRAQRWTLRSSRERVADANAAREWLQQQSYVNPAHVSLLGWSNGAIATLWAVRPRAGAKDESPDFRSAAAFYPSCRRLGMTAWSTRIPTLVLIGTADDWTPYRECEAMVAGAKGRSASAQIVTYRGAHHYFDRPNLPVQVRTGLAYTPDGTGRAHVGSDPTARADAIKRVPEFLMR